MSPTVVWRTKTDDEVYALLFPGRGAIESAHEQPDWARVHGELGRVGVTLKQFGASGRTAFDGEGFDELGHHAPSLAPVLVRVTGDDLLVHAVLYCFNVCWAGSAVFFRSEKKISDETRNTDLTKYTLLCELHGVHVSEGRVEPLVVVPPYVPVGVRAQLFHARVRVGVYELLLMRRLVDSTTASS